MSEIEQAAERLRACGSRPMAKRELKPGDSASLLIGNKWFRCVVKAIADVPHWSGNSIRRYDCQFPNGNAISCGRNSIRAARTKGKQ